MKTNTALYLEECFETYPAADLVAIATEFALELATKTACKMDTEATVKFEQDEIHVISEIMDAEDKWDIAIAFQAAFSAKIEQLVFSQQKKQYESKQ